MPGHALDAEGQRHGHHRRQPLGHRRHGQRHREDDHLRGAREALGRHPRQSEAARQRQHPHGNAASELVDAAFERRRGRDDVAEHGRQASHGAGGAGAGELEQDLAAHDQRAAEGLVGDRLVDGHRLTGQDRFVDHRTLTLDERAIGRDAIAGFQADAVARHEVAGRHARQMAVAHHPGLGGGERLEARQGRLGPPFLVEAEGGVEQQDHPDRQGFNRPPMSAFVEPEPGIEDDGEDQDVDERALELADEAVPQRVWRAFRQGVGPDFGQPPPCLCSREASHDAHRDTCPGASRAGSDCSSALPSTTNPRGVCHGGTDVRQCRSRSSMRVAFYDTKPYDRDYFSRAAGAARLDWDFHEFRLSSATAATAAGADAVCVFVNDRLDRPCLETLAEGGSRLVVLRCAGFNNVDLTAAAALGLAVTRVPAYSPHAVAEHAVALLLTLNRKIHRAFNRVREMNFSLGGLVGFDLHGKTIGIIGSGRIGRAAAQIFRGFGCRVLASDPQPMPDWAAAHGVEYVPRDELLTASDVVSLHLPLTPETHHLVDAATIAMMKPGAYLLNTSRGKLVETTALIQALKSGRLGGVALDVYEEEEGLFFEDLSGQVLQDDELSRLLTFPNVLITAHQGFLTREALTEIARVTVENVLRLDAGQPFLDGTTA